MFSGNMESMTYVARETARAQLEAFYGIKPALYFKARTCADGESILCRAGYKVKESS